MASKVAAKTTFEAFRTLEPIYTGGEISSNKSGNLVASCIDEEDALVFELSSAKPLVKIEGDGEAVTSLCLSPTAQHLVVCSRSLSMRIYNLAHMDGVISAELARTIKPHTTPVISSSIDDTGSLLVTGGADGTIKVWDIQGGYCSHTFHGHGGVVTAVEFFTTEGRTESKKRTSSGTRKNRHEEGKSADGAVAGSQIHLASGGEDGKVKVWNLNNRKAVANLDSHTSVIRALKFSPEQKTLLSAGRDRTIVLWDARSWSSPRVIPTMDELEAAGFVLDGEYCYAGGELGSLRLWSTRTGKEVTQQERTGHDADAIVAVIPVSAEDALLTVRSNQMMELQSLSPLKYEGFIALDAGLPILRRISGNHDEVIDIACLGYDKSLMALGDNTESVKVISLSTEDSQASLPPFGSNVAKLDGHEDVVICLDVDWSGQWLATGAKDNTARLWRIDPVSSSYDCFAVFAGHTGSLGAVALPRAAPSNISATNALQQPPSFLITGSEDKTVKKWDLSKLSSATSASLPHPIAKSVFTRVAHEKDINAVDTSPIAPLFASASQDRTIKIWSTEDGSVAGILRGHKRGVWSIRFSPANIPSLNLAEGGSSGSRGLLISGSGDNTVKVWSLSSYTCLLTFEGHQNSVLKVLWLPPVSKDEDENHQPQTQQRLPIIASASSDTLIKLWSPYAPPDSDHLLTTLDNHNDRVWSLATPLSQSSMSKSSSDQSRKKFLPYSLISGAADGKLTFWEDTSALTAEETTKAVNERIEQDQMLQNHILARNYREVITLSLALNHPGRLLRVFQDVVNLPEDEKESSSLLGVKAVDDVLANLSQEEIYILLERVRDWNTNARTATVAQKVLNCLFKRYPHSMWLDMARNRKVLRMARSNRAGGGTPNGMKDLFRALEVYTDRHYKRMEELVDESYLIEYTLREMDEISGTTELVNGNHGSADSDEEMITV